MSNINYEQIALYLAGNLNGEALVIFEKKLQEDADFAKEVKLYDEIEKSLAHRVSHQDEEKQLRANLTRISKEQISTKRTSKVISKVISLMHYKKLFAAASIAILIGFFIYQNKTPIYGDYASHEPMEVTVRGNISEILVKTQDAFNSQDYTLANIHLSRLAEYYKDNQEIQLYYAITFIETDQPDMAKMILERITKKDSLYKDDAYWYLALLALKQKDYDNCKVNLAKISKESSIYSKVKKLAKKL
jgi:anti-sigma-K factor RskA